MTPRSPSTGSFRIMRSAASRMTLNVPVMLTSTMRRNSSSGNNPFRPMMRPAVPMPAQFTTSRSGPARSATSSAATTSSSLVTSAAAKRTRSPSSLASVSPREPGRSRITTAPAPSAARRRTVASPRPDAPPVTRAVPSVTFTRKRVSYICQSFNAEPRSERVTDSVIVHQIDGVQVISINRPQARNAINRAVSEAVAAAVDELDERADLTLGIITGTGGNFCAGMDLKAFVAGELVALPGRGLAGFVQRPPRKPMIAAVEGWALAAGFEIALTCDLIVAAQDARFGLPEVKRGLVAAAGGLLRLPRRVPPAIAMQLALTGEPLSAADASRLGLVNELTAPGQRWTARLTWRAGSRR